MTTVPHPQREEEQLDTEETSKKLSVITKFLDEMPSETRDIHNWLQDKLMPALKDIQEEINASMYYLSMHEDRIGELEEGGAGGLDPEDAVILLSYLKASVEIFTSLQGEVKVPNLDLLINQGKECIEIIEEFSGEEPDSDKSRDH